ncbi:MAG: TatD family hydrolase [Verrucomicrobiota bacterium]
MPLIDSHCHPPNEGGSPTEEAHAWLNRAQTQGVGRIIAIGTDTDDWESHRTMASTYPGRVHWTVGLHPSYVDKNQREKIKKIRSYWESSNGQLPCAVGEIGLDYTRLPKESRNSFQILQREAFERQLQLAKDLNLPVVIHSRGTVTDCLEVLSAVDFPGEKALFHCFAEGPETFKAVESFGARCSFTGIITFKNAEAVRESLAKNGLERLILETDSPYLSPEPFRGKRNEPAHTATLAQFCADFFKCSLEEVISTSERNTRDFFGI